MQTRVSVIIHTFNLRFNAITNVKYKVLMKLLDR